MSLAIPPRIADAAFPIRLFEGDEEWVRSEAERLGVPVASIIRAILHAHVEQEKKQRDVAA